MRLYLSVGSAEPELRELLSQSVYGVEKGRTVRRYVADKDRLMILGAPGDHRCYQRRPDAASDIAHEVDQAGNHVALIPRYADIRRKRDRHEQKSKAGNLSDANASGGPEINEQPELRRRI